MSFSKNFHYAVVILCVVLLGSCRGLKQSPEAVQIEPEEETTSFCKVSKLIFSDLATMAKVRVDECDVDGTLCDPRPEATYEHSASTIVYNLLYWTYMVQFDETMNFKGEELAKQIQDCLELSSPTEESSEKEKSWAFENNKSKVDVSEDVETGVVHIIFYKNTFY